MIVNFSRWPGLIEQSSKKMLISAETNKISFFIIQFEYCNSFLSHIYKCELFPPVLRRESARAREITMSANV